MENLTNMQERLSKEPANQTSRTGWSGATFFNFLFSAPKTNPTDSAVPKTAFIPIEQQISTSEQNIKFSQQIEDAIHEAQEQEKTFQLQALLSASIVVPVYTDNTESEIKPDAVSEISDVQKEQELSEKFSNLANLQELLQQQREQLALKEKAEQAAEATRIATEEAARAEAARAEKARIEAEAARNQRIEAERQQAAFLLQQQQQTAYQQQCARESAEQTRIQNMRLKALRMGL